MRFVFSVALKYLIPKWRQLSVSIISIVSVLVISLVVWLAIVFLSVSEGVQNKWIAQLLALNAPVRITPTPAYFESYYFKIDSLSGQSGYVSKSIGEKLTTPSPDPYDVAFDAELPPYFPRPLTHPNGELIDLVKETWASIQEIPGASPSEFEVALGNLRLDLIKEIPGEGIEQTCLSQVSYFTNAAKENLTFKQQILPPTAEDLSRLLSVLPVQSLFSFFDYLSVKEVITFNPETPFLKSFYPTEGQLQACAVMHQGEIIKVIVPADIRMLAKIKSRYEARGFQTAELSVHFSDAELEDDLPALSICEGVHLQATILSDSFNKAYSYKDVELAVSGTLQGVSIEGTAPLRFFNFKNVEVQSQSPFWAYQSDVPVDSALGDGVVISKSFQNNGVRIGDRGYLSYFAPTTLSQQEQRMPVYVAGFYDPGLVAMGNRFVFVDPKVTSALRSALSVSDDNIGNGINVWLNNVHEARGIALLLKQKLALKGLDTFWQVESYHDYEFVRPILQQLQSDQTLFTLVSMIILLVACSNIISMLILLVNDKRKEIGVMLAMGATRLRIASIFGLCGCLTGLLSALIGIALALFTLKHIQGLVNLLSLLQGHDVFQSAFYGSSLPSEVSMDAIWIVLVATFLLSLIAGLVPAIKASHVKPTETLRSE